MKNQNFKTIIIVSLLISAALFGRTITVHAEDNVLVENSSSTPELEIPIIEETSTTTPTTTPTTTTSSITPPTPIIIDEATLNQAAQKIANYLKNQQSEDGKIIDGTITDWSIISFGALGKYADEIKNTSSSLLDFEKQYNLDDPSDLNSCSTYPRHILALLAAGVDINDNTIQGLKDKIFTVCYKDGLYGLNGINDDIFGLISLLAINVNPNEPIINDMISTTLSWQLENGAFSWPDWFDSNKKIAGDDITGAAINALNYAKNTGVSIDENVIKNASGYLKSTQLADGGWGYGQSDPMTTGWVLMGINSLGDDQNQWLNIVGKNPWNPLIEQLKNNGSYESVWAPSTVDWFAMKHAIPAILGKSWPIILPGKITHLEVKENITYTNSGSSGYYFAHIPTTETTTIATTTTAITTTLLMIDAPTSTLTTTIATMVSTTPENIASTTVSVINETTPIDNEKIITQNINLGKQRPQKLKTQAILSPNPTPENNKIENIINELPIDTSHKDNAKKMLAISGGGTIVLGTYLGLRLLKNVI